MASFPVEELCPSFTLRIASVLDLDPRAFVKVGSVVPVFQLSDDAFEVSLANQLEQPEALSFDVICITNSGVRRPTYQ